MAESTSDDKARACMRSIADGLIGIWERLDGGIDFYEIYLQLRVDFDVQLVDSVLIHAETVGDLFHIVLQALHEQHPERLASNPDYEREAWVQYVDILSNQTGLDRHRFVPSARFVRDLKL